MPFNGESAAFMSQSESRIRNDSCDFAGTFVNPDEKTGRMSLFEMSPGESLSSIHIIVE